MKPYRIFLLLVLVAVQLSAQTDGLSRVRAYRKANQYVFLREFFSLLSIPNLAADTVNIKRNTTFIMDMMTRRGIGQVRLLSPRTPGAAPAVYGEVLVPGAARTIIFYAHYDGQPVSPAQWAPGLSPFQPKLANGALERKGTLIHFPESGDSISPDWRIYARGASDDKAGVTAILDAYEALRRTGQHPGCNIKFFFEGEEEAGSTHLSEILDQYKPLLASDLWIICDGPVHQSGKKQVVFGVRGDAHMELTVFASRRPLHSGHYGNWAPNPALMLSKLLASMKNDSGRVVIPGFYEDMVPFTAREKEALRQIPPVDEQMKAELGIISTEIPGLSLMESINLPSLNINGMQSGHVGSNSNNIIPTTASADLDLRLVLGNDWQRQQQRVTEYIAKQGFHVLDHDPDGAERSQYEKIIKVINGMDGYNAQRTPMDLPIASEVIRAVQKTTTEQVVLVPSLGGSLPLFLFEKYLQGKTIIVPIANHDNNQHGENENIRLDNLWKGIETMASLMMIESK